MKENREQVSINGQVAMLALKYLYQFVDTQTYNVMTKQIERHKGFGEGTTWNNQRYNRSYDDTERLFGNELQPQALYDLLSNATNSGVVSTMSSTFNSDMKRARSLLMLQPGPLDIMNLSPLSHLGGGGNALGLMESGTMKIFKKLKTTYGHAQTEDGVQQPQEVTCACFDKSGTVIYTGSDDGLIKCWYSMTGQLMDSLRCFHAITDLAVSPDNVYLAGGTLMGELRIWARDKLTKVCTLSLSNSSINHIKWCYLSGELHVLACTDMTISIYMMKDIEEKKDLAPYVCLGTPTEAVAIGINKQGFLASGLSTGKIMFWKLTKEKDKPAVERYLFELQECQKKTYLIEWMISGSIDGKMVITRVSGLSYDCKLVADLRDKYVSRSGICNAIGWSVHGKYAIGALSGKLKANPKKRVSHLVVWDSAEEIYWTVPRGNEFELTGYLSGLSVHPFLEDVVVCGGGNGLAYLINIERGTVLQSFRETGVWSHASEIPADILECVFAPSGLEFAVSTAVGTISIYGALPTQGFDACPVEQFFRADYMPATDEEDPAAAAASTSKRVCNSRLVEHAHQVPLPGEPDANFDERLAAYLREKETYTQLEAEVLKEMPDADEEGRVIIRDVDVMREEQPSSNDERDDDYVEEEEENEGAQEASESEQAMSSMSDEGGMFNIRRRRRRRNGNTNSNNGSAHRGGGEESSAERRRRRRNDHEDSDYNVAEENKDEVAPRRSRHENLQADHEEMKDLEENKSEGNHNENLEEIKSQGKGSEESKSEEVEYHLDTSAGASQPANCVCGFCDKAEGRDSMVGPFVLKRAKDGKKMGEERLWMHRDCLKYNDYATSMDRSEKNWLGVRDALEKIATDSPVSCDRCGAKGCTVKCVGCERWFHGYNCCKRSGILLEEPQAKSVYKFRCYQCYGEYVVQLAQEAGVKRATTSKINARLSREWLLGTELEHSEYVPQLLDEYYYFFQGHEEFIREYFTFMCNANEAQVPELPWAHYSELLTPTLCTVTNVSYEFPDAVILHTAKTELQLEYPPVLMTVELRINGSDKNFDVFYLFQGLDSTPRFLIPKDRLEAGREWFNSRWKKTDEPQVLPAQTEQYPKVQVLKVEELEPITFPDTQWQNLVCEEDKAEGEFGITLRNQRNRDSKQIRVSYWDLLTSPEQNISPEGRDFNTDIRTLVNAKIQSNVEQYEMFLEDPLELPGYSCTIPCPMYYNLIEARLQTKYYRRPEAIARDIRLIVENARVYNEGKAEIIEVAETGAQELLQAILDYCTSKGLRADPAWFKLQSTVPAPAKDPAEMDQDEEEKKEKTGKAGEDADEDDKKPEENAKAPTPQEEAVAEDKENENAMEENKDKDNAPPRAGAGVEITDGTTLVIDKSLLGEADEDRQHPGRELRSEKIAKKLRHKHRVKLSLRQRRHRRTGDDDGSDAAEEGAGSDSDYKDDDEESYVERDSKGTRRGKALNGKRRIAA